MVKRTQPQRGASASPARPERRSRQGVSVQLMMECVEEDLSPVQRRTYNDLQNKYHQAMIKIAEANSLAKAGKAIITMHNDPRKPIPPPPVMIPQMAAPQVAPVTATQSTRQPAQQQNKQAPQRSTSPDVIFVSQSPPKKPVQSAQPKPKPTSQAVVPRPPQLAKGVAPAQMNQLVTRLQNNQIIIQPVNNNANQNNFAGVMRNFVAQPPNLARFGPPKLVQMVPTQNTPNSAMKRPNEDQNLALAKKKRVETDDSGNWVPLDEYYYGKMEGDPTYSENKDEFRFKCWYCNKMLYNNIKAMMHIQGHIDSSKQQNIDLSDLCQCKHCYKQFDTPFEMQTHVEKVHMNNVNVLLCRICERDHESRQALTNHMRQNHNSCEMPYICHLCNFRSSMYSDVVDHFKKKHDSSQYMMCLYCLKTFNVKFVSQGWGQTQTYYGHLLKHQSKTSSKKCPLCRLTFFNPQDVKAHKKKDHLPNQKGIGSNARYSTPGQVMIKVPTSGLQPKIKSLNAPTVSKILDFGGTQLPLSVNNLHCFECKMSMGTVDHYKKHIECSMCRYATSCSFAYANHMMGFHSGQMSSLNLNIPWERPMPTTMYCLCGFGSRYGNKIANHLVYCTKRSCYTTKPDGKLEEPSCKADERDPRHKPGASLLDVLGLVKKTTVTTKETEKEGIRSRSTEEKGLIWKPPPSPDPQPEEEEEVEGDDTVPPELKGSRKWSTVRITDPLQPSKASVFLGGGDTQEVTKEKEKVRKKSDVVVKEEKPSEILPKETDTSISDTLSNEGATSDVNKIHNVEEKISDSDKVSEEKNSEKTNSNVLVVETAERSRTLETSDKSLEDSVAMDTSEKNDTVIEESHSSDVREDSEEKMHDDSHEVHEEVSSSQLTIDKWIEDKRTDVEDSVEEDSNKEDSHEDRELQHEDRELQHEDRELQQEDNKENNEDLPSEKRGEDDNSHEEGGLLGEESKENTDEDKHEQIEDSEPKLDNTSEPNLDTSEPNIDDVSEPEKDDVREPKFDDVSVIPEQEHFVSDEDMQQDIVSVKEDSVQDVDQDDTKVESDHDNEDSVGQSENKVETQNEESADDRQSESKSKGVEEPCEMDENIDRPESEKSHQEETAVSLENDSIETKNEDAISSDSGLHVNEAKTTSESDLLGIESQRDIVADMRGDNKTSISAEESEQNSLDLPDECGATSELEQSEQPPVNSVSSISDKDDRESQEGSDVRKEERSEEKMPSPLRSPSHEESRGDKSSTEKERKGSHDKNPGSSHHEDNYRDKYHGRHDGHDSKQGRHDYRDRKYDSHRHDGHRSHDRSHDRDNYHGRHDNRNNYHYHGQDSRSSYHGNRNYHDNRDYRGNYHHGNRDNYRGSNRGHWGGRGGYGGYGGQQWGYR